MKILSIVGARPQFVKAAMVHRALRTSRATVRLLHTGQHYDREMSAVFFSELGLPPPFRNLRVGSSSHADQTARMMVGIDRECLRMKPDRILVFGDTNSTLAAALVAAKRCIPLAHVEAGLRSFNPKMPEEINRIVADRLSDLLFVPTATAAANLRAEGMRSGIHRVGDVMIDAIYFFRNRARKQKGKLPLPGPYLLLTLHRQENTDDGKNLESILSGLSSSPLPIVFPVHPRTRKVLRRKGIKLPPLFHLIPPVSYLEMIRLQLNAQAVWTDSGGVQKEAVVLGKPCFTLRSETEWVETVKEGWNQLLGADEGAIRRALRKTARSRRPFPTRRYYGDGRASEKIARILAR